jgi:acetyl esterase/lipase
LTPVQDAFYFVARITPVLVMSHLYGPSPTHTEVTWMALDEATTAFLAQMAAGGMRPLHEMTPEEARGLTGELQELYGAGPAMHDVRDETIPVAGGEILARVLTPIDTPRGVLVYFHGGGWVIGAVPEFDSLGRILAQRTSMTTVLVDYRLAPENRSSGCRPIGARWRRRVRS